MPDCVGWAKPLGFFSRCCATSHFSRSLSRSSSHTQSLTVFLPLLFPPPTTALCHFACVPDVMLGGPGVFLCHGLHSGSSGLRVAVRGANHRLPGRVPVCQLRAEAVRKVQVLGRSGNGYLCAGKRLLCGLCAVLPLPASPPPTQRILGLDAEVLTLLVPFYYLRLCTHLLC